MEGPQSTCLPVYLTWVAVAAQIVTRYRTCVFRYLSLVQPCLKHRYFKICHIKIQQLWNWESGEIWGPCIESPGTFGLVKPFIISLYLKTWDMYTPETSCVKETTVDIRNTWIRQLWDRKVWDFATTFRVRKFIGTFETGLHAGKPT